jgi:anti-sigma B factor antagonist
MLRIEERKSDDWIILDITGRIQAGGADVALRDKVNSLVHQGWRNILLNLQGVSAVDSIGLGALIAAKATVNRLAGRLELVHSTKRIQDLVVISGLLFYFSAFDSEEEAMGTAIRQPVVLAH